ncbi:Cytochrome P450 4g15 [Gryllus bimaculatus]|nr:Cytochrome P450 4g15 [Gryllus bimaculatus]
MSVLPDVSSLLPNTFFYPLLFISLVLWYLHQRFQSSRLTTMVNKLPGPTALPLIGNLYQLIGRLRPPQLLQYAISESANYEKEGVVRFWLGPTKPVIGLFNPADIEVILSSNVHLDKSVEYRWFQPWLGDGLLINSGEKWRTHRKLIAPAFHLNVLKSFIPQFNSNAKRLVQRLRKEAERGTEFDVHDYMSESTVDVLIETAMGVSTGHTGDRSGFEYAMAVMKMCDIVHQRAYKFWLRLDSLFQFSHFAKEQEGYLKTIHGLSTSVIKKKKELFDRLQSDPKLQQQFAEDTENVDVTGTFLDSKGYIKDDLDDDVGEKKRQAFLDLLLETKKVNGTLTDAEIKEEVDTIMFEGHDTTAAGSSFVLCLLGIHQDVQTKVMQELNEIFGDSDRPATFNDTLQMKYLERVILETLRMYPPVPLIARKLNQDVKLATGYTIPANCTVVIGTFKVHRHPQIYENPNVFNPDNFLPEKMASRHYYSYIPFSAGPRSCVLLSTLLRNYKVVSNVSESEFVLRGDIILKRDDGFRIKLEPRSRVQAAA